MKARLGRILAAALLVVAVTATAQGPDEVASLRVLHLSPDAPLVDVLIEGRLHVRDLGLRDRSAILTLPAGRHDVRVYPHRLPTAEQDNLLTTSGAEPADAVAEPTGDDAEAGAAATGNGAEGQGPTAPEATARARPRSLEAVSAVVDLEAGTYTTLVLTGNFELPSAEGQRGHLSIDVDPPEATVTVSGPQGFHMQRTGDQLLADLEPGAYEAEVRLEGYQEAVYGVDVTAGGTAVVTVTLQEAEGDDAGEAPSFQQPEEAQGGWRTLELQPYASALPLPPPARALVRFVHSAPTVPHLDIRTTEPGAAADPGGESSSNDEPGPVPAVAANDPSLLTIERLAYPNASDYLEVPAGVHGLEFRVAGTDNVVYALPDVQLRAGFTYTLFVAAGPTNGGIWIVPTVDAAIPQRAPVEDVR